MSTATKAVFLSYAREDTDAARRIADALRSHGVEVWFDQSELRGGDAWDQKIRRQIGDCALFVPLISAHTQERSKGYFRLEWKLAVEQTHLMAEGTAYLAPVVVDDTTESGAVVPPEFLRVQWTRLPGALATPQFVEQIKRLLHAPPPTGSPAPARPAATATNSSSSAPIKFPVAAVAIAVAVLGAVAYFALRPAAKESAPLPKPAAETKTVSAPAAAPVAPAVPLAPDKSIAVLPFANMSPDKDNEFFADGVHEDVITNLAKIRDLKVISRTSVLAYRDTASRNLKKIASELGVATVLEGSVRRVGTKVRVTAQLIDARTDEHLWAETYDRDLTDVFAIQSTLATEIANALKANLTVGERAYIAEQPTQNLEAYDLYVRARTIFGNVSDNKARTEQAIALCEQAVAKDPTFVAAHAQLAYLNGRMYWYGNMDPTPARRERAKAALDVAVRLAPDKPETRRARGAFAYYCDNDWALAQREYRAAAAVLPNDAQLAFLIGVTHRRLGALQDAAVYMARAMELNPHELTAATNQLQTLNALRRYEEVRDLSLRYLAAFPGNATSASYLITARLELGHDVAAYLRDSDALTPPAADPAGLTMHASVALERGDLAAAERFLADPRLTVVQGLGGAVNDPVALRRAEVAFLRGQREAARAVADEAVAYYSTQKWTPRQAGGVMIGTAMAQAFAGRADEAIKLAKGGYAWEQEHDRLDFLSAQRAVAQIYLVLDRRDDAFAMLREMMTGPSSIGPEGLRLNPLWKRVKDDPRFEEILKLAKPL